MVRKGTELHKVQQKIFREAYCAEGYLTAMEGFISKYDTTWQRTESVSNMLACIIFEMGWEGDYRRFCENEKSLTAQALSQN
jgi:hypothetical protein